MTATSSVTRAGLRRAMRLEPVGQRLRLAPWLAEAAGPIPDGALELVAAYLCDPRGRAIEVPDDAALAAWFGGVLFDVVGPRQVAPWSDEVAAILVAGPLTAGGRLSPALERWRFSPRADIAVAAAVAVLPRDTALEVLERLARTVGPDEERLHQALLQATLALGWADALWDAPLAETLVDRTLSLLVPASPQPLLDQVVDALLPIARAAEPPIGARVREAAAAGLRRAVTHLAGPPAATFLDEVRELARERAIPDEHYWTGLPWRQAAQACARLLGAGAPPEPARFAAFQAMVLADLPDVVFEPFVEGLVASASRAPLEALAEALLAGPVEAHGLALDLAARFPLDAMARPLAAALEARVAEVRRAAVEGTAWLEGADATASLAGRLADPEPRVAAAAARRLVERGEVARVRAAAEGASLETPRGAALAMVVGEHSTRATATLVNAVLEALDTEDDLSADPSDVLVGLLADALLGSERGLAACADLLAAAPGALPVIALAATRLRDGIAPSIVVPAASGRPLGAVLLALAQTGGVAAGEALVVLARISSGDPALVAPLMALLDEPEGYAGHALAAAAMLRVRDGELARRVAALLDEREPIGARVMACAAAGFALPVDDPAWANVEALLGLGTVAGAAAWTALRERVRFVPLP